VVFTVAIIKITITIAIILKETTETTVVKSLRLVVKYIFHGKPCGRTKS
jgi:hypothetical protein